MLVRLLRDARVKRSAGEIVEVSPAEAAFLVSCKSAVLVDAGDTAPSSPPKRCGGKRLART